MQQPASLGPVTLYRRNPPVQAIAAKAKTVKQCSHFICMWKIRVVRIQSHMASTAEGNQTASRLLRRAPLNSKAPKIGENSCTCGLERNRVSAASTKIR